MSTKKKKTSKYKKLTAKDLRLPKGVTAPRLEKLTAQDYKDFLLNGFKRGLVTLEEAAHLVHEEDPRKPEIASDNVKMTLSWLEKELSRNQLKNENYQLFPFKTVDGVDYFSPGDIFRHMTARNWDNYSTVAWSVLHEIQTGNFENIVQQRFSDENYKVAADTAQEMIPGIKKPALIEKILSYLPNRVRNAHDERIFLTVPEWYLTDLLKVPGNIGGRGKKALEDIPKEKIEEVFETIAKKLADARSENQSKNQR